MKQVRTGLAALALILAGCVGTEVGNPQDSEASVDFAGYEHADPRALTFESGARIERAWLSVESLELREASDCDGPETLQVEGPFAVDLVGGQELPEAPTFTRPATSYCKLKLRLRPLAAPIDGAPEALTEASLYVTGETAGGVPFEVRAELNEAYVMVARGGEFSLERAHESLLVGVALNELIEPALADAAESSAAPADTPAEPNPASERGEDQLLIDAQTNQSSLAQIKQSLRSSLRLFRDRDEDGRVDAPDALIAEGELTP